MGENYATLVGKFFEQEPESWGGAYVDGDVLVVKAVRRTVDEATALLAAAGVVHGVRVVTATRSIVDLDTLTDRVASMASANVVNRPGESGDSGPWEGWGHVWSYFEEVPGRAA